MNPYRAMPARQFWSRAVATGHDPAAIATVPTPLVTTQDKVASAGSCFAANLVPYLEAQGITYVRTEQRHPVFAHLAPDNFSYDKFSAAYGNIYTVRQLLQLILRVEGEFAPAEDRWHIEGQVIDPFRPGLRYPARSDAEFDILTRRHLRAVRRAFTDCTVFILTLGLTEAWVSTADGAVFPACPGTIAGTFDPSRHAFHNFTVEETIADLDAAIAAFRRINTTARIILTVSPVPLIATATDRHVVAATTYSKSVLRVAAEQATRHENVVYFPSYEIVTSSAAPADYFEQDRRSVSARAVESVMAAFFSVSQVGSGPAIPVPTTATPTTQLSRLLAEFECEEEGQDAA